MKKLISIAVAFFAVVSSQAVSITQTNTFSGTPAYDRALTFDKFNDNGGTYTLNSVIIWTYFDTLAGATLQIDNEDENASSGVVYLGANGTLASSDVRMYTVESHTWAVSSLSSKTMNLAADDGDDPSTVQADGADYDILTTTLVSDSDSASLDSYVFSDYIGNETYDLNFKASQFTDFSALGGVSYGGTPVSTSGKVVVEYNYAVPEPATVSMMLFVGGLGFLIRRHFVV